MRKSIAVIHNPAAGQRTGPFLAAVCAALGRAGATVTLVPTEAPGHATLLARDLSHKDFDLIVAAGGDGTIREVAAGLDAASPPLGVIPAGTANVLARDLGLIRPLRRRDPDHIARSLLEGAERPFRQADAGSGRMAMMAGAGYDGAVVARVDPAIKARFGRVAFGIAGLRAMLRPLPTLTVETTEGAFRGCWFVASLCQHYAGPFWLAPDIVPGEPLLHGFLLEGRSRVKLALALIALPLGLFHLSPGVRRFRAERFSIKGEAGVEVEIDGDVGPRLPLTLALRPEALRVVCAVA